MKVPYDAPEWAARFVDALEDEAGKMLAKAKTADEALRAAGAFSLLRFASSELEIEVSRQEDMVRANHARLNEHRSVAHS